MSRIKLSAGSREDFQTFQTKLLLSLSSSVSMEQNLQAVTGSTLAKLMKYCGARLGMHIFYNPEMNELHALVVGSNIETVAALEREMDRRHTQKSYLQQAVLPGTHAKEQLVESQRGLPNVVPDPGLPKYLLHRTPRLDNNDPPSVAEEMKRYELNAEKIEARLKTIVDPDGMIRVDKVDSTLRWILESVNKHEAQRKELVGLALDTGADLLLIPMGFGPYRRLGCFVLWFSGDGLNDFLSEATNEEALVAIRKQIEQLLVRMFSNYYHISSATYLPSYHKVEQKSVALVCAQIRDFHWLCEIHRQRQGPGRESLRQLVNRFSRVASEILEIEYGGRVDQQWGSGLVAVFGEYLDWHVPSEEQEAVQACRRALEASVALVQRFEKEIKDLFEVDDALKQFKQQQAEAFDVGPAVAIDYGQAVFDYIGSAQHMTYMAVGDRIELVKSLAAFAGGFRLDDPALSTILRELMTRGHGEIPKTRDPFRIAPILMSQPVFARVPDMLKGEGSQPEIEAKTPRILRLPGRPIPYAVYEIYPENLRKFNQ